MIALALAWLRAGGWRWVLGIGGGALLLLALAGGLWLANRHLDRSFRAALESAAAASAARVTADVNAATAVALARAVDRLNSADEDRARRLERVRTVTERVIREQRTILAGPAGDAAALDAVGLCLFNQSVDLANGDPVRLCPGPAAGLPAADAADGGSP